MAAAEGRASRPATGRRPLAASTRRVAEPGGGGRSSGGTSWAPTRRCRTAGGAAGS